MAGSVYSSVYVLKPINRSACGGVVRPRMKRGHKAMTVDFLETRGSENRREVVRPDKKATKGEVRTWSTIKPTPERKHNKKKKCKKKSAVHQVQATLNIDEIRKMLGSGLVRPDKVEYHRIRLFQGKQEIEAYELRARCCGHWLTLRDLIAAGVLESAAWVRYSGALRRDLCLRGLLQLMEHYGLEVPESVRLAAEKAEGDS